MSYGSHQRGSFYRYLRSVNGWTKRRFGSFLAAASAAQYPMLEKSLKRRFKSILTAIADQQSEVLVSLDSYSVG